MVSQHDMAHHQFETPLDVTKGWYTRVHCACAMPLIRHKCAVQFKTPLDVPKGWYIRAHRACAAPLAHKLRTYFLKMRAHLDGTANTHHAVDATAHSEPNFAVFFLQTQRECRAQFGRVFKF